MIFQKTNTREHALYDFVLISKNLVRVIRITAFTDTYAPFARVKITVQTDVTGLNLKRVVGVEVPIEPQNMRNQHLEMDI